MNINYFSVLLVFLVGLIMAGCSSPVLKAPEGFRSVSASNLVAGVSGAGGASCPVFKLPEPSMDFPSKYQGSDSRRNLLNLEAAASYKRQTKQIYKYANFLARLSDKIYAGKAARADLDCYYHLLLSWAEADAMVNPSAISSVGRAVRKWTLASLASNYLKVSTTPDTSPTLEDTKIIARWFSRLADAVVADYSDRPLRKVNNHDYWAAWAVMATAVVLNSRDYYAWSIGVYNRSMGQITEDGFLPNELRRDNRAQEYHNFALLPLSSIRAFLHANGYLISREKDEALNRLANNLLVGMDDGEPFARQLGTKQSVYKLQESGRLSWLPALLWVGVIDVDPGMLPSQPLTLRYTRLGGDACELYAGFCNSFKEGR